MTSHQVGSLVHDLVAMAKALEDQPGLQERIKELEARNADYFDNIANLQMRVIDTVNAHEETKIKLRRVEEDRDSASFRELEAQDKVGILRDEIKTCISTLGEALKYIEPPKPEPMRPDYSHKWLTDVDGWMGITLNDWVSNGGADIRFTVVKPMGVEVREQGKEDVPVVQSDTGQSAASVPSVEGREQVDPTVLNPVGQTSGSETASEIGVSTMEVVGMVSEGQSEPLPFAQSSHGEPSVVAGEGVKDNASSSPTPKPTWDEWATPSNASHYSS